MTGIRITPAGAPLYVGAIPPGIQVAQSGAAASPLLTDLVAYWKLDETSGTRFDSAGINNLADNGGVGSTIGIQGNAASFAGSVGQYLSIASNSDVSAGAGSKTWALWVKPNTVAPSFQGLLGKDANPPREYEILMQDDDLRIDWFSPTRQNITIPNVFTAGSWHLVLFWYDSSDGSVNASINNGTVTTLGRATGNTEKPTPLTVGYRLEGPLTYDGLIDEIGIWGRVLTPAERTQIYNGGAGITYPFT
jgi:hypothetical protein